ncbi:uncharacterized protein METZ01_LOCUS46804 [marine metagenome]|uniref:Uncharacterized protein n=1 Tax=marine metagenome TaxID=408172 RepID=A0A381RPZ6_9ZZZZ
MAEVDRGKRFSIFYDDTITHKYFPDDYFSKSV